MKPDQRGERKSIRLKIESCGWAAWTNSAAVTAALPVPDLRPGGLMKISFETAFMKKYR
ncbi:hypothetical protein [Sphingobium sp. LMC3-1-1.1]|uniref:hypothetical protein n=1 Tax=unclassified Sphingobium TaxID=2611147 RepID=UPI003416AD74